MYFEIDKQSNEICHIIDGGDCVCSFTLPYFNGLKEQNKHLEQSLAETKAKLEKANMSLAKIGIAVLEDEQDCLRCTFWSDSTTTVLDECFIGLYKEHDGCEDGMVKILKQLQGNTK